MLKILSKISMILFLLAVPFLFYGFGRETFFILKEISLSDSRWIFFIIGFITFFPIQFLASRLFYSLWCYLQTLEHELTHLIIGLIFFKIPTGIRVTAHEGGEVRQTGRGMTGQTWISLAPYFFPTVSLAIIIFSYFLEIKTDILLSLLGWSTAFHLISNWTQTSFRQTDLQDAGIVKTILILPIMNLICYGSILAFVEKGSSGFFEFWVESLWGAFEFAVRVTMK